MGDSIFKSFWQAGYEGADHVNGAGHAVDMNSCTAHDLYVDEDYASLRQFGILTVRESLGWRVAHARHGYDFSRAMRRARCARRHGIQILWTLCHYGLPPDCSPLHNDFVDRCADFCAAAARAVLRWQYYTPVFSPINEISFFTWALTSTDLFGSALRGAEPAAVKSRLIDAARAAAHAIRNVAPDAVVLLTDPACYVAPASDGQPAITAAAAGTAAQYEAWDALLEPADGSAPTVVGINYYHANQWEHGSQQRLDWASGDARRRPFRELLQDTARRYERPLLIAETSHVGAGRADWLLHIAQECAAAIDAGVDLRGICLYPIVDRPDWNDTAHWHKSGLWDVRLERKRGRLRHTRILDQLYAQGLRRAQALCQRVPRSSLPPKKETTMRTRGSAAPPIDTVDLLPLVVYSHLRWGSVFQRPQHLMSRLAKQMPVIFVEEPVYDARDAWLEHATPAPNVRVITPHTPLTVAGYNDEQCRIVQPLLQAWWRQEGLPEGIAWFYTPMALGMLARTQPRLVIYDCMDELSAFRNAPAELREQERELFARADLVFTGGPSLYRAKAVQHSRVHCFPSSVDVNHFSQAMVADMDHPAQRDLAGPRIGFFGVIDERLDLELLAVLAARRPNWQCVMLGPVVKIPESSLPRACNLHYLGQQPYDALPSFVAGWDVCIMPFALNEATRFISPTKTLEYLAAGKPVVSTAIADVVELYGPAVSIADDADAFVNACEQALTDAHLRALQANEAREMLARTSWNRTVSRMRRIIQNTLARRESERLTDASLRTAAATPARKVGTVILGAGPTGLSAAYHLDADTVLLERNATVGGWCRSVTVNGFTFDYAGHIMFSNDPYVLRLYEVLLRDNVHWQNREAWIHTNGVFTRYPFQSALYGLPTGVLTECLLGAIEAHVNRSTRAANTAAPPDFERFIYDTWGSGVARHFALPYNQKLWTVPLAEMETSWLGGRVPLPNLEQMIEGAISPSLPPQGPNARFGYPLRGGFQALMEGFLPHLRGKLELEAEIVRVLPNRHRVLLADGRRIEYDSLISTAPLPRLIEMIGDAAPPAAHAAAARLRHVSVRCVHLGIGRAALTDKHWIYYPEDTVFHRIFVQGNASPLCNAPGGFGLTCEITYSETKPLPCTGQALIERCIADCIRVGMFTREDPIWAALEVDMPCAYVVYDHERARNVELLRDWLTDYDIVLAGRYSEWQYYNSDHAFLAGKRAADHVRETRASRDTQHPAESTIALREKSPAIDS